MNKNDFLAYFKSKKTPAEEENGIKLTGVFNAATSNVSRAELHYAEEEQENLCKTKQQYQKSIPDKIKSEVGKYASEYGTQEVYRKI